MMILIRLLHIYDLWIMGMSPNIPIIETYGQCKLKNVVSTAVCLFLPILHALIRDPSLGIAIIILAVTFVSSGSKRYLSRPLSWYSIQDTCTGIFDYWAHLIGWLIVISIS